MGWGYKGPPCSYICAVEGLVGVVTLALAGGSGVRGGMEKRRGVYPNPEFLGLGVLWGLRNTPKPRGTPGEKG